MEKVGYLQVRLFNPFSIRHFLAALPQTVRSVAVLDRCKEMGAAGEPLYLTVCAAFANRSGAPRVVGGRYGLSSKDTTPAQIKAVFDNLAAAQPTESFTIGIVDDVTHRSLPVGGDLPLDQQGMVSCKFWGLGSDGTVGANKNSIKIIGQNTDMYTQAYFEYDTKKSFGITKSHLRFGKHPILSTYLVRQADFIACHNQSFLYKYDIVQELKPGGPSCSTATGAPMRPGSTSRRRSNVSSPNAKRVCLSSTPTPLPGRSAWATASAWYCSRLSSSWPISSRRTRRRSI